MDYEGRARACIRRDGKHALTVARMAKGDAIVRRDERGVEHWENMIAEIDRLQNEGKEA